MTPEEFAEPMTCRVCGAPAQDAECCSEHCRLKLECKRIAWDRAAKMVAPNGYYDRRYREHVRNHNTRGAKTMLREWETARATLGERP